MCGIVSVVGPPGSVAAGPIRRALDAIRHRGPDGEGVWIAADRSTAIGHVRLSLVGLDSGAQPISSEDGRVVVAVNGEFYGHQSIRRRLERLGHRFRTDSDSEIALHLYEEHGLGFLEQLRGEFALIVHDGLLGRLIAARDRFGIKPLCYARDGDRLVLASEAKALFAVGIVPSWDHEAVFRSLSMQYPPPDRTLFQGVRQLRPGHWLIAEGGTVVIQPYWDMDYPAGTPTDGLDDPVLAAEAVREALEESVKLRLGGDVPVACHLSGGLDSSSIAALAARHVSRVTCFTVSFEAEGYDEQAEAHDFASRIGVEQRVVAVRQADLVEHLSDSVYFSEGLAINGHLPAKFLLSRAIRDSGFKAVLSGEGADEILGGYAHLKRDLILDPASGLAHRSELLASLTAANPSLAGIHLGEGDGLGLAGVIRALGFVPSFLEAKATLGHRARSLLARGFVDEFASRDPFADFLADFDVPGQLLGRSRVDQSSYLWSKSALAQYILRTLGDGTEMAHSVEGRLPFLDHHLFALVRRLPLSLKIRGTTEKFVLREAMRGLLPDDVYRRPKFPFTAPPLSRFPTALLGEFLEDELRSAAFADLPFFDSRAVCHLLDRLPSLTEREQTATDPVLMLALTAHLLQRRFRLG